MSRFKLVKSIGSMSAAVFLSRISGLIRDMIFAYYFGATYLADAFHFAYEIPNLIRKLFGEGALSAAFIPEYKSIENTGDKEKLINFGLNILTILAIFLLLLSILGILFAGPIVRLIGPGFDEGTSQLTIKLTKLIFPYLFLIGLSSTLISILNAHGYFFIPGISTLLLNFAMIGSLIIHSFVSNAESEQKIKIYAFSVVVGGILQTVVNLPILYRIGYRFVLHLNLQSKEFISVIKRFIPGMIGLMVREINLLADKILASLLPVGSIAALTYGNRLMQLPLGIFGISVSTAVLPLFSEYVVQKKWSSLQDRLKFSIISLSVIMLPTTMIIIALGKDIIRILFMRGVFDENALIMSYKALVFYSLGLVFYSINRTIIPIFYANKNTKTPVKISAVIVIINISLNIGLMRFLQHSGLALATSLTAMIHLLLLTLYLKKYFPILKFDGILPNIIKSF
ncbi:MAG: murein biosynthesis integral membrane protein MurJ, partial [Candidatus Cloacimonetes bacterium]|nr:murein biosynthesis integral membrane protein MurJ [Candidatus Cloacimonadota bacterium]